MKQITFRPLRQIKKTGKIVVASSSQWHSLAIANYNPFMLTVIDEYKNMPHDEQVYDHEGSLLFFPDYDPNEMPVFSGINFFKRCEENIAFQWYSDGGLYGSPRTTYYGKGINCLGAPTFTHYTIDQLANAHSVEWINKFEPLTVGTVINWLGWFLMRLENAKLKVK